MVDGQQGLIVVYDSEPSKTRVFFTRVVAIGASLAAVALATSLAYFIFQGLRKTRFDNVMDVVYRYLRDIWRLFANMDPYVAAWAIPLIGGLIVVVGMLIYRHFDK